MAEAKFGVCSLEDDECNELFITQTPKDNGGDMIVDDDGDEMDFLGLDLGGIIMDVTQKVESVSVAELHYSDILDPEDDFMNPIYGCKKR